MKVMEMNELQKDLQSLPVNLPRRKLHRSRRRLTMIMASFLWMYSTSFVMPDLIQCFFRKSTEDKALARWRR